MKSIVSCLVYKDFFLVQVYKDQLHGWENTTGHWKLIFQNYTEILWHKNLEVSKFLSKEEKKNF
jgi:hypothetical protein